MHAAAMLQEAAQRLQEAVRLLEVEGRGSRLSSLQRQLVARRCRLAAAYGAVYAVGPKTGLPLLCMPIPFTQASVLCCLTTGGMWCSEFPCGPLPSALWGVWAKCLLSSRCMCGAIHNSGAHKSSAACHSNALRQNWVRSD